MTPMPSRLLKFRPASARAWSSTSCAEPMTSPVGVHALPMILLSCRIMALVVEEPESMPAVIPTWRSLASSSFFATMVTSASILVSSCAAFIRSVNEYVTTGSRECSWMYRRTSFLTRAPSAQRKQVAMNTASAS